MDRHDKESLTALYKALDYLSCNDLCTKAVNEAINKIENGEEDGKVEMTADEMLDSRFLNVRLMGRRILAKEKEFDNMTDTFNMKVQARLIEDMIEETQKLQYRLEKELKELATV